MINIKNKFNPSFFYISVIFLFLSILFFMTYSNNYIKKQFDKSILRSIENLSVENSISINNEIKNKFNLLTGIANSLTKEDLENPQSTVKNFEKMIEINNLKNIDIAMPDGISYATKGEPIDISDRDYFIKSMKGDNYVSEIVISRLDGKKTNIFSVPIFDENKVIGVLTASVTTEEFVKNISFHSSNKLGFTFIIDENGNLIAHENNLYFPTENFNLFNIPHLEDSDNHLTLKTLKENIKNLNNGYVEIDYANETYYMYYTKLDYSNWWLLTPIQSETIKSTYSYIIETMRTINIIILLLLLILFAITLHKEKKNYNKLKSIAYMDLVTEGRNNLFLKENISSFIKKEHNYAFCSLEVINIKNIINIFGVNKSNFLLKEIYMYLSQFLKKDEIVVHSCLGEFNLLIKYDTIKDFTKRIDKINFSNIDGNIKFKIGIYLIDKTKINFENMCSYTNIAKEALTGDNKYFIYNNQLHKREVDKINLEQDIKRGIENKEFKSWFQPKFAKDGKTIIGAEALVRWYKYGSIISPYIFIPLCEKTGLIRDLDELLFEDICKNLRLWINKKKNVVPISVNLSRAYMDKIDFIETLEKYINKYQIPRELIEFEITESSMIENEEKLKLNISSLRNKGFKILLDDFGVGYSSIKTISDIHFDTIKIDKSFVNEIGVQKWEHIINYTISLGNKLGMDVIAEGIETEEQYKFLLNCNCNMFQGYYFSKPLSPKDFSNLI